MIQIKGERGQETEKIYTLNVFMHSFFPLYQSNLKKKVFLFQIHYFIKKNEA